MKVSKQRLKRIIREELEAKVPNSEFPVRVGYQGRSEDVYNQDALDALLDYLVDNGVPYSIDKTSDLEPEQVSVGADIEQLGESEKRIRHAIRGILMELEQENG
jgi:hypothetical protein